MRIDPLTGPGEPDDGTAKFLPVRPRLFGIAYSMLGTAAEAEDIVQDVWLRWQATDRAAILDPEAFLATATIRLSINLAQSARSRRETYIGPWLPEPVDTRADPTLGAERAEALELAVLFLLEKLPPTERAAYILREAFDYSYRQIATIFDLSEANVRQIVTRARKHIAENRRAAVQPIERQRLLHAFLAAAQNGDVSALESLLTSEVVSYSDGGGVVQAATKPVVGRAHVAKFVGSFASRYWAGVTFQWVIANGETSLLISRDDKAYVFATIHISDAGIDQLMWVMNPAKLASISAQP